VIGRLVMPLMLKAAPVTVACETDTAAEPAFDKVIVCELLLPVLTVPKLALDGFAES
jgi:hypothetical protein